MGRTGVRRTTGVLALLLLAAAAGAGGYLGSRELAPRSAPAPATSGAAATPSALAAATDPPASAPPVTAPVPVAAAVSQVLAGPLADARLGARVLAEVLDAGSGAVLYQQDATATAPPASTAKLATATALLTVRRPSDRISTRVVAGAAPGTVVLVGGGDPTLTAAAAGHPGAYPDAARISDLARQLAGRHVTRVVVDSSLFTGPAVSPAWPAGDLPSDYAAPITAAMVDGGRDTPTATVRSTDPAGAAGRALAAALHLPASAVTAGKAPAGATVLAGVQSPPLRELIAQMLQPSDNVIAECLARQVALATHQQPSFTGAAAAIRTVLGGLGVDLGTGMQDGSGLAPADRLSPSSLTALLRLDASPAHPRLHDVVAGLPVAGWDGTLAGRYHGSAAAGMIRAKTGTLTGVSALAGLVHDRDGRLLAFAVLADRVRPSEAGTDGAEAALDAVAAALAGCGCR